MSIDRIHRREFVIGLKLKKSCKKQAYTHKDKV